MSEEPIQASEIAEYVFCRRAWYLRRQGVKSANVREMRAGASYHQAHGRLVRKAQRSALWVYLLIALAIVTMIVVVLQLL